MILGKIQPEHSPRCSAQPRPAARPRGGGAGAGRLLDEVAAASGERLDPMAAAEGLVAIAVANMARAIRAVSVARGEDPASYALACFGGRAGSMPVLVADALGMERVLIHPLAGVLSAVGIGLADRSVVREATVALPLGDDALTPALATLQDEAKAGLAEQGVDPATIRFAVLAQLRYARNDQTIAVPWGPRRRWRRISRPRITSASALSATTGWWSSSFVSRRSPGMRHRRFPRPLCPIDPPSRSTGWPCIWQASDTMFRCTDARGWRRRRCWRVRR